ncbi:MAG: PDZ domain-containing protein, partial [Cyclobacteriaceae bacterium]|nr:PDZ domain-containing protein [Cyclobacteriaceae bacterium]
FYDLKTYGEVQKAFFGGEVEDFNSEIAKRFDIDPQTTGYNGVLLVYLQNEGAAKQAGLKEGDIITAIDQQPVETRSIFEEEISYRTPGDKITVTYKRDNQKYNTTLVLTNREGTTDILKRKTYKSTRLGAEFEELSKVEKDLLGIDAGVRVFNVGRGKLQGMEEDFIITHINRTPIKSAEKLIDVLENIQGVIWIEGVDKKGSRGRYRMYGN